MSPTLSSGSAQAAMLARRGRHVWGALRPMIQAIVVALAMTSSSVALADDMSAAFYLRVDSDRTVVVSPRTRLSQSFGEAVRVDATYGADVWTSASVDVRASASVHPVWEQRDEVNLNVQHNSDLLKLHAGYRVSLEPDYESQGVSAGFSRDVANKAATIALDLRVLADTVGRAANPSFARGVATYTGNLTWTQLLDPMMLMQLTYELTHIRGYQASPYRFIGIGPEATGFGCRGAGVCLPELVPHSRSRHAASLMLRRALGSHFSAGLTYRFYIDDWGLISHTGLLDLGWSISDTTLLSLRYRVYRQGSAEFYMKRYLEGDLGAGYSGFRTRDKELSSLTYHRVSLELEHELWRAEPDGRLTGTLAIGGNRYHYAQFVGLNTVAALEITAALLLEL